MLYIIFLNLYKQIRRNTKMEMFFILSGGLLIIIFAVIAAVSASVTSAVAADVDDFED